MMIPDSHKTFRYYTLPGETEIGSAVEQPVKGYPGACATDCRQGDVSDHPLFSIISR